MNKRELIFRGYDSKIKSDNDLDVVIKGYVHDKDEKGNVTNSVLATYELNCKQFRSLEVIKAIIDHLQTNLDFAINNNINL